MLSATAVPLHAPRSILVVDDDAPLRKALSRLLSANGYSVATFGSAEELLAAERDPGSLLVLDVDLPGMSGPALYQHLCRTQPAPPPAVFISGGATAIAASAALAGVALLEKPFDAATLLAAIQAALQPPAR